MDFGEECDLDTLADLLDEGEDKSENIGKCFPSTSSLVTEMPGTSCETTSTERSQQNQSKTTVRHLKDISIDLFSTESNDLVRRESENSYLQVAKDLMLDSDSSDDENKTYLTETGKAIKKNLSLRESCEEKPQRRTIKTWKYKVLCVNTSIKKTQSSTSQKDYSVEEFSGIRIVNPLVSHDVMKTRMVGRRMIKMSFIRNFMKNGDIEGDWVTVGVLVNKFPPKTSKNGKTFSIWKMTDLHDVDKIVTVFLFGSVHVEHWKTAIGTVVGILNPSIMPNRDKSKAGDISLSVDHAGKFMIMGTAKDFGHCKGRRKDGTPCTVVINKSQCEYCTYHVGKEYKKLSSKRVELQASYSGTQPNLKKKVFKGQNIMYGGQLFSVPTGKIPTNSRTSKDKLRLNNLTLKRKAEELETLERLESTKKLSEVHGIETDKEIRSESQFINQQLTIPTVGAKNLFQHLMFKEKAEVVKKQIVSVTPKELLKMHEKELRMKRAKLQNTSLNLGENLLSKSQSYVRQAGNIASDPCDLAPQLGRGCKPGDEISLDMKSSVVRRNLSFQELAKLKAIQKIKEKGSLKQQDPNAVKSEKTPELAAKIELALKSGVDSLKCEEKSSVVHDNVKTGLLGSINLSSEKINRILNKRSSHAYELEVDELERQEMYFRALEKKEQMEEKMASTTEIVCDVVSCKLCKYTSQKASDRCKEENHPLRSHKATKRFFSCIDCKHRTVAFTKLPTKACRRCGGSSFERTSMLRPRERPKLENEILKIRGDEIKFLNSFKS